MNLANMDPRYVYGSISFSVIKFSTSHLIEYGDSVICLHAEKLIKLLCSDAVISLPTFIIAECVLIYLDPDSSRDIVGWASKTFSTGVFFLYEQVLHILNLMSSIYFLLPFSHSFIPPVASFFYSFQRLHFYAPGLFGF